MQIKPYKSWLFLVLAIFILWLASCFSNNKYSKEEHLFTDIIGIQLYSESYRIESYGVGGDVYSIYITDSLNFREFVSLYYDYESIQFKIIDNKVLAIKEEETRGINNPTSKKRVKQEYKYDLKNLKLKGEFD